MLAGQRRPAGIVVARPVRSEVVSPATDRVTGHPEHCEYHAHYQYDDTDRPDDGNPGDEPDNEENDSEDDQGRLLTAARRPKRRQEDIAGVK
jgi:hypothetical protein